jgi:hypothetical protein
LSARSPRPTFGAHDYEISFSPPDQPREVNIRAKAAHPLRIGDHFTVRRLGFLYDLIVEDVSHLAGGHWSARCGVDRRLWV